MRSPHGGGRRNVSFHPRNLEELILRPLCSGSMFVANNKLLHGNYMKNKNIILMAASFLTLNSSMVFADTTYGVGVGINDSLTIYFPISAGGLIVEPLFSIYKTDANATGSSSSIIRDMKIGIGVFKNEEVFENSYFYYGVRMGYVDLERNTKISDPSYSYTTSSEESGYFVSPTLGTQHYLFENISIGVDIGIMYSKRDGSDITNNS